MTERTDYQAQQPRENSMWTGAFWKAATERAVKTAAQTAGLVLGADMVNVIDVDWVNVGGFAAGGLVLSYLFSLASGASNGNPSAGNYETLGKGGYLGGE